MADETLAVSTRVARNSASLLTARLASYLSGLLTLPVVHAHLGERAFGVWVEPRCVDWVSGARTAVRGSLLGVGLAVVRSPRHSISAQARARAWGEVAHIAPDGRAGMTRERHARTHHGGR
ncbi:hypothetical protein [Actinopolymorpha rutila]|uniref:Uncharacterized protein n=1 Tax=Actinopolymorpha rutila TaxID=446787 RepID=A0A852Z645_9ACTN|nr:hypothetical protein [Actinopolymorpha rutila]NYH88361.1 hypothetical protein [Actinopolymorpha rutila]